MSVRKKLAAGFGLALLTTAFLVPTGAQGAFGIKPGSLHAEVTNEDGTADFQAGSHPFDYTVRWGMNRDAKNKPEGRLRHLFVEIPPGVVGNPQKVPACKIADFEGSVPGAACFGSQVGFADIETEVGLLRGLAIYNLEPPLGAAGMIGFSIVGFNSFQEASVRSDGDYGLTISDITIPTSLEIKSIKETIWGVPADKSHDAERQCITPDGRFFTGCESNLEPASFLSMPTSCGLPPETTLSVDSLENPGVFDTATAAFEEAEVPTGLVGCNALEFNPTITSQPTTNLADSPTGLNFNIHQPQNEAPEGLSTAHLKDVKVTLPQGMTLNPSAGNGLAACEESAIGYQPSGGKIHFSKNPQSCPDAAKVGSLEVKTPLLKEKLPGAIYVAKPYDNPFGSLLAIYLAVESPDRGIVAKLAGKVEPDPTTGQLTATFTENPQLPLEDIETHFFNGPRAALKTPFTCGTKTTTSTLVPWSTPEGATVHLSDSFETSVAAGGGICPTSEAKAANKPSFNAGTIAPEAGAYSPFVLKLTRQDGTQRLTGLDATLPKGLTGKLAGIPYCSEAQLAVAKSREAPNLGALEQQSPSCPAASEIGTVTVGAGAGITPLYVGGHAYLAGPYKGAPISMAIITPAVAGPFDLGAVMVRTALQVDPETAQIHAVSDPFPTILQGIPLDLRSVTVNLAKPQFTLNPTSCDPAQITGSTTALSGAVAPLTAPFQVGGCSALKFAPKIAISLKGGTKRNKYPALKAVLTYPKDGSYANIASAQVTLPHSAFLEQGHIGTVCTRVQFAADACPKASIYGFAKAVTPLLDKPVEGPVYLRSSSHELPDLVASLDGQVSVDLAGRVDTGKGGGIRNTFEAVPDAPVSKFTLEMKGGKKGLLVNSENICKKPQKAIVSFTAQNGDAYSAQPLIKNDCGKRAKKKGAKGKKGSGT